MSVFVGGFSLDAAEVICPNEPVLDLLTGAVDRSLVVAEEHSGRARYRLLETVRQYLSEKLVAAGEYDAVRDRHRDWCLALVDSLDWRSDVRAVALRDSPDDDTVRDVPGRNPHRALIPAPTFRAWLDRLELEADNLRAALEWCERRDARRGLHLAAAMWAIWTYRINSSEGREWLHRLLARAPEATNERGWALATAAFLAWDQGDFATARDLCDEGLAIARSIGDARLLRSLLRTCAVVEWLRGDYDRAHTLAEEALTVVEDMADKSTEQPYLHSLIAWLTWNQGDSKRARAALEDLNLQHRRRHGTVYHANDHVLAMIVYADGDDKRATDLLMGAIAGYRREGDRPALGLGLAFLGYIEALQGSVPVPDHLQEGFHILRDIGHRPKIAMALACYGILAIRDGLTEQGVQIHGAAAVVNPYWRAGDPPSLRADVDASLATARFDLGDTSFEAAWNAGLAMTVEEALALPDSIMGERRE
jgi:non-specific serine/threonine protein kinase